MFPSLAEKLYQNQPPFNAPDVWKYVINTYSIRLPELSGLTDPSQSK
jgi:hypothetical protein